MSSTENVSASLSPADRSAPGIKAVLLVGGMGTRLRSVVSSTPGVLARIREGGRFWNCWFDSCGHKASDGY